MRIILPAYITEAERIAAIYGVTLDDLRKKDRCKSIVIVRKRAMKAVRDLGASLKEVGAVFERDHTTVIHSLRKVI